MPRPLEDELLYSVVARAALHLGHWSPKRLLEAVFDDRGLVASPDLPGSLATLETIAQEEWALDLQALACGHTLAGYYTHFLGPQTRQAVLEAMAGKHGYLHVRLGICAGTVAHVRHFRLCSQCVRDDMCRLGHTYWRRSHHLPGVLVCPAHGAPLLASAIPFRPTGRHEYVAAQPRMLSDACESVMPTGADLARALRLARACRELLDAPPTAEGPLHDYRPRLRTLGLGPTSSVRAFLRNAVESAVGHEVLKCLFKRGASGDGLGWIDEVLREPRRPLHPVKHVLMSFALEAGASPIPSATGGALPRPTKAWGLYRSESLRIEASRLAASGLRPNAIARALGIDPKTASRLLAPIPEVGKQGGAGDDDRAAWLALVAQSEAESRSAIRRLAPALYARLYRTDRTWLLQQGPRARKGRSGKKRVDWLERDQQLATQVHSQAEATIRLEPPLRASRNRILTALNACALVRIYGENLPLTLSALEQSCETVKDFQIRRLQLIGSRLHAAPDWWALRAARLNPARFADGGRELLDRARSPGTSRADGTRSR